MKLGFLILIILAEVIYLWSLPPVAQNLAYHQFADVRSGLGVVNFFDVMSNIPFLLVGLLGVYQVFKIRPPYSLSWLSLFIGVALVAPGSMYYHLNPINETLVWDRLPMTVAFMSLTTVLVCLYFKKVNEKFFLFGSLLVGLFSIWYWATYDDLRIYIGVQLTPILLVFVLATFYRNSLVKRRYLFGSFVFYLLAKLTEKYDGEIFEALNVSGHTIKHLLAAVAVVFFISLMKELTLEVSRK